MLALLAVVATPARADVLPYRPAAPLPAEVSSPPVAADAPFTATVNRLLAQLLPSDHPTPDQVANAAKLLHGISSPPLVGPSSRCGTIGSNDAPQGTDPAIAPLCWTDAQGVNVEAGNQVRQTTAPPTRIAMSSSWDRHLLNAWGQVEGHEGRALGITGIYAPQVDLERVPAWGRNLTIFGEDPLQAGTLGAAEANGIQGSGMMTQVKHVAFYDGQFQAYDARVQDQAAHELYLQPYEYVTTGSGVLPRPALAASAMCSYARFELVRTPGQAGAPPSETSPGGSLACDHPFMNRIVRDLWKWPGFFASDYIFALDSTVQSFMAGNDQEMPTDFWYDDPLVAAVESGAVPLERFKLALARILYQEERFHLLGHPDDDTDYLSPSEPADSQTPTPIPAARKFADGAVSERAAEEGAVLLKNAGGLPLKRADFRGGVLVVGESAEYMPADPGPEQADGYPDRDAISPLAQLRQFAPKGSKITFLPWMPGKTPPASDGSVVPGEFTRDGGGVDRQIDFTATSGRGQLAFGKTYSWTATIDVPAGDDVTFQVQFSVPDFAMQQPSGNAPGNVVPPACSGSGAPTLELQDSNGDFKAQSLSSSPAALSTIQTNPTASGFIERGLANCQVHVGTLDAGTHRLRLTWTAPASFAPDRWSLREPGSKAPSLRFAWSRAAADRDAAVAAAKRAAKVVVFADCACVSENTLQTPAAVNSLDAGPTQLIEDLSKANPNTVVVTNVDVPTLMPWLDHVRSVLQMWYPGSEGGTATARLLLGKAVPGGHLTSTWPKAAGDTIYAHSETVPLYAGDTTGVHKERFDNGGPTVDWTEGMFMGYRFFDKEKLAPLFPFGFGLSYTSFRFTDVTQRAAGEGIDVGFDVRNTGRRTGAVVPQVYLGPARGVPAGVQQPERELAGFDRVVLRPGQATHEVIHLGPGADRDGFGDRRAFQYWDSARQAFVTAPGARSVWVGEADDAARLQAAGSGAQRTCRSRRAVAYTLPRGASRVRLTLNGKRRTPRIRRHKVRVAFTGLPRGAVEVRISARVRGHRYVRRSTIHPCVKRRS